MTQAGGVVSLKATVHDAASCTFITEPPIAGVDGTVRCANRTFVRHGSISASAAVRTVDVELLVSNAAGLTTASTTMLQRSPQTLLTDSGTASDTAFSGSVTTPSFTIPATDTQWTLTTTYDCSGNFDGFGDVLISASGLSTDSVNLTPTGAGSYTSTFHDTGTLSLDISADCNWSVTVVG